MGTQNVGPPEELNTTSSLEGLQSDEQRRVLDIVAQLRKCGLESILSLPQLVVCGDQSAGKSSVLEALTEIPFPRNDNLCTRFATEIILRRAMTDRLTIKMIPDAKRPQPEQETIKAFKESITNFDELPHVMEKAMVLMGIESTSILIQSRAFAKDILSVEIEGPSRPQLTLVDLPGLIQTETKGVTKADVDLVAEITDHYISQPRTICLAVVSATNDYANQGILTKVRKVDPDGERTLGIITKPDRLSSGSGMEKAFFDLALNDDIFFKLGWHVLKNRSFEEGASSFLERNASEAAYFRTSIFKTLPQDCVGIDTLRNRLSQLLFAHVKQELPKLREDLEVALTESKGQLHTMGNRRATPQECRAYLAQLSLDYYGVCKAAVGGHYEGEYFNLNTDRVFSIKSEVTIRRLRAVIQYLNTTFSDSHRMRGHKYRIDRLETPTETESVGKTASWETPVVAEGEVGTASSKNILDQPKARLNMPIRGTMVPTNMSYSKALEWVSQVLKRTRGRELPGNFNPLLVGELLWEQCSNWYQLAVDHVEEVSLVCSQFLAALLQEKCPKDIHSRLWSSVIQDTLKSRNEASVDELELIMKDVQSYPINYNHYYTDVIKQRRQARGKKALTECIKGATKHTHVAGCHSDHTSASIDVDQAVERYSQRIDPDMEKHSCEEALDCLFSIYKVGWRLPISQPPFWANHPCVQVTQKTFIANITTQVIERHIVRGLEEIFSPVVVNALSDSETEAIASEPASAKRQREFLEDRIGKLSEGYKILRDVIRSAML